MARPLHRAIGFATIIDNRIARLFSPSSSQQLGANDSVGHAYELAAFVNKKEPGAPEPKLLAHEDVEPDKLRLPFPYDDSRSPRESVETALVRLLADMFAPDELYRFVRHQVSREVSDALSPPEHTSRIEYADRVGTKLMDRGLLNAALYDALSSVRKQRTDDIRALARQASVPDPLQSQTSDTVLGIASSLRSGELSRKLGQAQARKTRLQQADTDTTEVDQEILALKRSLRHGGQLQVGDLLESDRYLLLSRLGRGGFATVWKARDHQNNTDVAIKVLHGNLSYDPISRDRFFRGARIMAELNHPSVIRVLQPRGNDDHYHYFVMELATGGTLRQAVLDEQLTPDHAIGLLVGLGRVLAIAHDRGYIHRDVKPANVLLTRAGQVKLTDFDLVHAADTTGGTRTGALGTFVYAAPEQLDRPQDIDGRADIYGLAMTAAFVLHGSDLPSTVLRDAASFIRRQQCSPGLAEVLERAVQWEPDLRFATMDKFCDALERALSGHGNRMHRQIADVPLRGFCSVAYRPIVYAETGTIFGQEAYLSYSGAITALDAGTLSQLSREFLEQVAVSAETMSASLGLIFVNVGATDLCDRSISSPSSPLRKVAHRVVLELTSQNDYKDGDIRRLLAELRSIGFRIAVDDMGKGYARMNLFGPLDIDFIKLDSSLVRDVDTHPMKQHVMSSIVRLSREQNIMTIAQGVTSASECRYLTEIGCDLIQGAFASFGHEMQPAPALSDVRDHSSGSIRDTIMQRRRRQQGQQ
ncbi:MAG: EAL domain-containing protein [Proteobacteria bacterium]|nr:EAL domain-containing protein [Pseudomonadota bacterium]